MIAIYVIMPGVISLARYVYDKWSGAKVDVWDYVATFLLVFAVMYGCTAVFGDVEREVEKDFLAVMENREDIGEEEISTRKLSVLENDLAWKAWYAYCEAGYMALEEAKANCIFVPSLTRREKVIMAINMTISILKSPKNPKAAIVECLAVCLVTYFVGVYDEWEQIEPSIEWSEHCFQMADKYWKMIHS